MFFEHIAQSGWVLRIVGRRKALVLILFITVCLQYPLCTVFSQAKEFERIRSSPFSDVEAPRIPMQEISAVDYFIAVGDILEIFVWQNPDLSKDVIVGPDGKISVPLAGRIKVIGMTITQLENQLQEKLSRYVKYPQVSVMVKKISGSKILVLGEINYPGIYTYQGAINLLDVIALAGDFTEEAREDSVMVVRGIGREKTQVMRVNILALLKKGTTKSDINLEPDDVVYVPKSFIANFNKFLNNLTPLVNEATSSLAVRKEIRRIGGHIR